MATSPIAEHRNGNQAAKEATRACKQFTRDADICRLYDTLATAFAEIGDFKQALKYQEQALTRTAFLAR